MVNQIKDVRFHLTTPPLWPSKHQYNAVFAERSMEFGNIVRVETSRYLTKITTLQRKSAAKHIASLQLLSTVGGNQARFDARTEFVFILGELSNSELPLLPLCSCQNNTVSVEIRSMKFGNILQVEV